MLALCQSDFWLARGHHFGPRVPLTVSPPRDDVQVLLAATLSVVQGVVLVGSDYWRLFAGKHGWLVSKSVLNPVHGRGTVVLSPPAAWLLVNVAALCFCGCAAWLMPGRSPGWWLQVWSLVLSANSMQYIVIICVGAIFEICQVQWPWRSFCNTGDMHESQLQRASCPTWSHDQ